MAFVYTHETLNNPIRTEHRNAKLSELDLTGSPPLQTEIHGSYWEKYYCPDASLDKTIEDVHFEVKPSMDAISLADSYMELSLKLQKQTSSGAVDPDATRDVVGITNNVLYR